MPNLKEYRFAIGNPKDNGVSLSIQAESAEAAVKIVRDAFTAESGAMELRGGPASFLDILLYVDPATVSESMIVDVFQPQN
jgi:hypothetical protein